MDEPIAFSPPAPHAGQREVLALPGRFRVAVCGRRFGKTVAAMLAVIQRCEHNSDTQRVWWISPIQEQSDRVEREMVEWLKTRIRRAKPRGTRRSVTQDSALRTQDFCDDEDETYWDHRKQEHALIYSGNGSRIEFHSAHVPDRLRGAGLNLVVIDEAADVSEYTWNMVIKPMLLDAHGEAFILGTPRGAGNWLHRLYLLGQDSEHARTYRSIRLPTTRNPRITREELDEFRADMSEEEFKQEFEAEFVESAGAVFTKIGDAIDGDVLTRGRAGELYVTGIDLGEHQDFTVLCSVGCRSERLEGFARFNRIGWHAQVARIKEYLERFHGPCIVDNTGVGDPIFSDIQRFHNSFTEPFRFSAAIKEEIVRGLALGIESKELKLARVPQLIDELKAFSRIESKRAFAAYTKYGAPQGLHDDCVIALALAWYGLKKAALWAAHSGPLPLSFAGN
jgi:hypothetical protein